MQSNMGEVTQLALKAIEDENSLWEKYSTPEDVLDYLKEDHHFKSLRAILKDAMVDAGICNSSDPQSYFVDMLYDRLVKQDADCGIDKPRTRDTIERWLSGYTKSIRYRNSIIEICFALQLDAEHSKVLLNKCGYSFFNVRNAEDATYLYCIINHRPLSVAKDIMSKYRCAVGTDEKIKAFQTSHHNGNTTVLMRNQLLENTNWEDDDSFLNTFLIPNKSKFIGFSLHATNAYYVLKNCLFLNVLTDIVTDEEHHEDDKKRYYKGIEPEDADPDVRYEDIALSSSVRSALKNTPDESVLSEIRDLVKNRRITPLEALKEMRRLVSNQANDISTQKEIAFFLNAVIKNEGLLKHIVYSIKNQKGRIREYRDSMLNMSVMKEFPDDKTFAKFESDPSMLYQGMATRKAIVLMYYFNYAYEMPSYLSDLDYVSRLFEDVSKALDMQCTESMYDEYRQMGFSEFFSSLNIILEYCQLSPLYPANQFDWLVLRSIREFESPYYLDDEDNFEDDEDYSVKEDNPITFFNDVLAYSFGDTTSVSDNQ